MNSSSLSLAIPANFATVMGDNPVTVEDILSELESQEVHMASGDCGHVSYMRIIDVTRMRLSLATSFYGADSTQVQEVLRDLCFNFYMACKYENAGKWAQVVHSYDLLNYPAAQRCTEYVQEARQHLKS